MGEDLPTPSPGQWPFLLGKTRSACIREAISHYLARHGDAAEARRQSEHLAQVEPPHWSEQLPDWNDWTA